MFCDVSHSCFGTDQFIEFPNLHPCVQHSSIFSHAIVQRSIIPIFKLHVSALSNKVDGTYWFETFVSRCCGNLDLNPLPSLPYATQPNSIHINPLAICLKGYSLAKVYIIFRNFNFAVFVKIDFTFRVSLKNESLTTIEGFKG